MLVVKKFGGTSVANKERIYNVARRCIEEYQKGNDVVVVLSAMGKMTDELIEAMKPWYDNYCFAEESYGRTTMYNSNMVLYFVDNYIRSGCQIPKNMIGAEMSV